MFNWLKPKPKPDPKAHILELRDTLFADAPFEKVSTYAADQPALEPWASFRAAYKALNSGDKPQALALLRAIAHQTGYETRVYIQAWNLLRFLGEMPPTEISNAVQGVIVEVEVSNGLDIVAGYTDHSARYYNYSGAGIIWENPAAVPEINKAIDDMLTVGQGIADQIKIGNQPRPGPPKIGNVNIHLLAFGGWAFGVGSFEALSKDQYGKYAIGAALNLMKALTNYDLKHRSQK